MPRCPRTRASAARATCSPKFSLVLAPRKGLELFFNAGRGFHSNDARGATITVDPTTGDPAETVNPLVDATAIDIGLRAAVASNMQSSVSAWQLDLDSELLFVGDAGTTEPSRGSQRRGVEATLIWNSVSWLILDADLAWSRCTIHAISTWPVTAFPAPSSVWPRWVWPSIIPAAGSAARASGISERHR